MDSLSPERGMKVTMLLADAAQVAEGKLNILGAGWATTGAVTGPCAIVGKVDVPWSLTNIQHDVRFELIDLDGHAVMVETPNGPEAAVFGCQFEVGRPPGTRAGSSVPWMFAINIGPLPLGPDSHFEWRLLIDEQTDEDWRLPFSTRPEPGQEQARAA